MLYNNITTHLERGKRRKLNVPLSGLCRCLDLKCACHPLLKGTCPFEILSLMSPIFRQQIATEIQANHKG